MDSEEEYGMPHDARAVVLRLWKAAAGERWRLAVATIFAVLYVVATLATPIYSAYLIDCLWALIQASFEQGRTFAVSWESGGAQVLGLLGVWTLAWLFYSGQALVMSGFAERLNLNLRKQVSRKINRLPLAYFDARQPGETISRVTNDLDKVSEVMQRGLLQLLISTFTLVGAVIMMTTYDLALTGLFALAAALSFLLTKVVAAKTYGAFDRRQAVMGRLSGKVEEAYTGRAVIKAFGDEEKSFQSICDDAEELARAGAFADFLASAVAPVIRFLMRLAQVVIALLAGRLLLNGTLSVGRFQAVFQYITEGSEPLTEVSGTINLLQGALAGAERVFSLLDQNEVEPDPKEPLALPEPLRGRVAFEHVRFGYRPGCPLMKDVNLVAEPGQKVAIVGATGAGKTTLINLLMRFYEVDGGHITIDGVDTRSISRSELRRSFGMVLQDSWLFEGTIAQNIAYGKLDATRDEVEAAARAAHVDFFVRTLPQGYDTVLTNDTESVSQGQRQLLTIARAMLADPAMLILDEATSSVDTRTEQYITRAMEAIMEDRTSFVIAHRLSTVVDADLILVMDHGDIIEQGTHLELLAKGGRYAELYQSQFA